jgi:serine/threonine protein kinase
MDGAADEEQHKSGNATPHSRSLPWRTATGGRWYRERVSESRRPPIFARTRLGKYLPITRLATGGMAEIFLARLDGAAGFQKKVALKLVLPDLADDEQFVSMFLDEARLAAQISHPNVCQIYELGQEDGQYFIAMEYLDGMPLTALMKALAHQRERAEPRMLASLLAQACEGLHHAHELRRPDGRPLGLIHRDVSPPNLFVTVDGVVKVLDFGIAKAHDRRSKTKTGLVKGKFSYMSPEQIRGMPVDARTDVFSTGIILHEMLTTEKLFRGDTEFALMEKVRKAEVPPPSKFNRRVPEALDRIVLRALARDLPDRYQSAKELGDELASFMSQYRFQPTEMQEFVRGLFRADYSKEAEEIESCRRASIDTEPEEISIESGAIQIEPTQPISTPDPMPAFSSSAQPTPVTSTRTSDTGSQKVQKGSSGLWSRLRDKFTK